MQKKNNLKLASKDEKENEFEMIREFNILNCRSYFEFVAFLLEEVLFNQKYIIVLFPLLS